MANNKEKKMQLFAAMMAKNDDRIERMAFSQEDLDELISSGVTEIIICVDGLRIPLDVENIDYYGMNTPTVVINSNEVVDFDELGISIEDCVFDEKYTQILEENEDYEETNDINSDEEELLDIQEFYEDVKECFSDYREEMLEIGISEDFYEYFSIDTFDESDTESGDYCHETKAKAKLACKEAIEEMVKEAKDNILSAVEDYLCHTSDYFDELSESYQTFIGDLSDTYDSSAATDCDEDAQEYVMSKKREFFADENGVVKFAGIPKDEVAKTIMKDLNKKLAVRPLLQDCDYDDDGEDYCYDCSSAVESINDVIEEFVSDMEDSLPQQIYTVYMAVFIQRVTVLEEKFDSIFGK